MTNASQPLLQVRTQIEYLGYSVSSLKKKRAVWFLCSDDKSDLIADEIRKKIGRWNYEDDTIRGLAKSPSKWGARIALAFTESIPVVELSRHEWGCRDDYGPDKNFPNTDGCGVIHPELCNAINAALLPYGFTVSNGHHTDQSSSFLMLLAMLYRECQADVDYRDLKRFRFDLVASKALSILEQDHFFFTKVRNSKCF